MKCYLTALLVSVLFSFQGVVADDWYDPQVGEPHADFVLPRMDTGEAVSLSQFRGQKVLLIQFASW